jgi:hypothetical protein
MNELDKQFEELISWLNRSFRKIDELENKLDEVESKSIGRFMADWIMSVVYNLIRR